MCCCGFTLDYFDAFVNTLCQNRIFETAHMYQIKQQATCSVDESRSIDMKMYPIIVGRNFHHTLINYRGVTCLLAPLLYQNNGPETKHGCFLLEGNNLSQSCPTTWGAQRFCGTFRGWYGWRASSVMGFDCVHGTMLESDIYVLLLYFV